MGGNGLARDRRSATDRLDSLATYCQAGGDRLLDDRSSLRCRLRSPTVPLKLADAADSVGLPVRHGALDAGIALCAVPDGRATRMRSTASRATNNWGTRMYHPDEQYLPATPIWRKCYVDFGLAGPAPIPDRQSCPGSRDTGGLRLLRTLGPPVAVRFWPVRRPCGAADPPRTKDMSWEERARCKSADWSFWSSRTGWMRTVGSYGGACP